MQFTIYEQSNTPINVSDKNKFDFFLNSDEIRT